VGGPDIAQVHHATVQVAAFENVSQFVQVDSEDLQVARTGIADRPLGDGQPVFRRLPILSLPARPPRIGSARKPGHLLADRDKQAVASKLEDLGLDPSLERRDHACPVTLDGRSAELLEVNLVHPEILVCGRSYSWRSVATKAVARPGNPLGADPWQVGPDCARAVDRHRSAVADGKE
jgi:hypothetical protein